MLGLGPATVASLETRVWALSRSGQSAKVSPVVGGSSGSRSTRSTRESGPWEETACEQLGILWMTRPVTNEGRTGGSVSSSHAPHRRPVDHDRSRRFVRDHPDDFWHRFRRASQLPYGCRNFRPRRTPGVNVGVQNPQVIHEHHGFRTRRARVHQPRAWKIQGKAGAAA